MARLVWCDAGKHYWEREPRRGRVPISCPQHAGMTGAGGGELWCEAGQHSWRRPRAAGRPPMSCPEHSSARRSGTRWIGDLRTCFLLQDGWAFRLHVNRFHIKGRGGWRMPLSLAESLGLEEGETRSLKPMKPELFQEVGLTRVSSTLRGGSIDIPLVRLGAKEGDHVFFCIRGDRYDLVLRPHREARDLDALGMLLWSCGLDPLDEDVRHSPWRHLARALGGEAGRRNEVRRRLLVRKDDDLIALLDRVEAEGGVRAPGWIDAWQYRAPILPDGQYFILEGGEHGVRVAVGVADVSGHIARGLLPSDGGLLWLDQPSGLIPRKSRVS